MMRQQLEFNTSPGPHYMGPMQSTGDTTPPVRVIAFYLPQFHPIPENDAWWGRGFTEWTNVTKALPQFDGHYQPRLPSDLGFYDLRLVETLRRQAQLANDYGISGFCFHYYWFSGRKILQTPIEMLLAHPEINIQFCLSWANENWTRTWHGDESEVLLKQDYEPGFEEAFIFDIEPALRDPRYIRIAGRPLLMIYRPDQLPDAAASVRRWRTIIAAKGLGDPFIAMVQFGTGAKASWDPRPYGMDAAVEFPPHKVGFDLPTSTVPVARLDPRFHGGIRHYDDMVSRACSWPKQPYRTFRGVCPSWDNSARRPHTGNVFVGATPENYRQWLSHACREARLDPEPDARFVFVNAWNEWAEGAHLEPDRHFGHAYLANTAQALRSLLRHEDDADLGSNPSIPCRVSTRPDSGLIARLQVKLREIIRSLAGG